MSEFFSALQRCNRMDMISSLPNEIICHMVSFLSAKEAVFTSLLSKKWQNLFTIIPELKFDDTVKIQDQSFEDFVDGVLALPSSTRVRRFCIRRKNMHPDDPVDPAQHDLINRCLVDVLNRGVLDLEVDISVGKKYSLPYEVFMCKTVVKMKLGDGFSIKVLPENAFLPALKTLTLNSIRFKDRLGCAFEKLLFACGVLKKLTINDMEWERWRWSGKLCSPTLERLTIRHFLAECDQSPDTRITLDTPNLTYLDCSDAVPDEYPIVNLDSLVEAKLDLMLLADHTYQGFVNKSDNITSNPSNLIKGLRNVQIMEISSENTHQAFDYFREAIPVFRNLYHLNIRSENMESCMQFLPFLIKKTPNLETLVIDGPLHYSEREPESVCKCLLGYSFLSSCPVEVLEITEYRGTKGEVEQLKHIIEKLSCLKSVKLRSSVKPGFYEKEKLRIPRATSKCKIEVTFSSY